MSAAPIVAQTGKMRFTQSIEYLVVTDKTSKILKSTLDYNEAKRMACLIRRGGGEVTIFKATKG